MKAVGLSYWSLFNNLGVFFRLAGAWIVVVVPLGLGMGRVVLPMIAQGPRLTALSMLMGLAVVGISSSSVAVGWHRLILLKERPKGFLGDGWSYVLTYALRVLMVTGVVVAGPSIVLAAIPRMIGAFSNAALLITNVSALGAFLLLSLAVARICLVLPAAAVGEDRMTLLKSWGATAGNTWRLLCGGMLVLVPALVVRALVEGLVWRVVPDPVLVGAFSGIATLTYMFVSAALAAGYLSAAYRHFVEQSGEPLVGQTQVDVERHFT